MIEWQHVTSNINIVTCGREGVSTHDAPQETHRMYNAIFSHLRHVTPHTTVVPLLFGHASQCQGGDTMEFHNLAISQLLAWPPWSLQTFQAIIKSVVSAVSLMRSQQSTNILGL